MTTDALIQEFAQRLTAFEAEAEAITTRGACWRLQRLADEAWMDLRQGFATND